MPYRTKRRSIKRSCRKDGRRIKSIVRKYGSVVIVLATDGTLWEYTPPCEYDRILARDSRSLIWRQIDPMPQPGYLE